MNKYIECLWEPNIECNVREIVWDHDVSYKGVDGTIKCYSNRCDTCGMEWVDPDLLRKNKNLMIKFKIDVDKELRNE